MTNDQPPFSFKRHFNDKHREPFFWLDLVSKYTISVLQHSRSINWNILRREYTSDILKDNKEIVWIYLTYCFTDISWHVLATNYGSEASSVLSIRFVGHDLQWRGSSKFPTMIFDVVEFLEYSTIHGLYHVATQKGLGKLKD